MSSKPIIKMYSFTIDCKAPKELASFYAALLHWEMMTIDEEYALVYAPNTGQGAYPMLTIQKNPDYTPPVWPAEPNAQQQMAHLDFAVDDLEKAVEYALQCGAKMAEKQFSDGWRVMIDPAGHPFCLCQLKSVIDSEDFALL